MPPEAKKYLFDMQRAAASIQQFVAGKTLDEYRADLLLRSGVERQFMILGEALFQINRRWPDIAKQISDHRAIVSFRHVLVHGYDSVRDDVVWGVIETDLGLLQSELASLPS